MPFFSIIIPVFNRAHLIRDTLTFVLNQTFRDNETIVIDDGSTGDSLTVLQEYCNKICVYAQPNSGAKIGRNFGIRKAKGEYIVAFDSDDIMLKLQKSITRLTRLPKNENPLTLRKNGSLPIKNENDI